ncbi:MAG: hypothetical protein KC933_13475 [Myxococcales bacterium]|nr:hypothetical protein [Myxococcales bacterium]
MPKMTRSLLLCSLVLATAACGESKTNNGTNNNNNTNNNNTNNNNNNNNPGVTCPASASLTVCDLKVDGGEHQPQLGDPVVLEQVVVTSPTFVILKDTDGNPSLWAFFVQDLATTDELDWRFSGIEVTYRADVQGQLPAVGDVIRIEGSYRDFGQEGAARQKQLSATFFGDAQSVMPATPKLVADASAISTGGTQADDYEGVLVKLENLTASVVTDVPGANGSSIFGAFVVDGGLIVSGTIYEERRVAVGEEFNSITGVLRMGTAPFDSGISMLTPRSADDVDRKNPIVTVDSVVAIQDPTHPDHPSICQKNPTTTETCPAVDFKNMTVTANDSYVSTNLRALWIQDMSVTDGKFAGIKVTYAASLADVPQVGNVINVTGQVADFYGSRQLEFPTFEVVNSQTATVAPIVVSSADLARNSGTDNPYEGVLVEIQDVEVTTVCVEATNGRDFGNFLVTGNVFIGNAFNYAYNGTLVPSTMCDAGVDCSCAGMTRPDDNRTLGDRFTRITGVMNFSFDDMRLEPRGDDDLVLE